MNYSWVAIQCHMRREVFETAESAAVNQIVSGVAISCKYHRVGILGALL